MQWSNAPRAGFTDAKKPWLPIHSNFLDANVEVMYTLISVTVLQLEC